MRLWTLALILPVLFASLRAMAAGSDAGTADAAAVPCGAVPADGQCAGTMLSFCDGMTGLVSYDCVTVFGSGATCELVNMDVGYDCRVPTGSPCQTLDGRHALCKGGASVGCLIDAMTGAGLCTNNLGPCTEPVAGAFMDVCGANNLLLTDCTATVPDAVRCADLGAASTCMNNACINVAEGAPCDSNFLCASGLQCDPTSQTCEMPGAHSSDAGFADGATGTTGTAHKGGCRGAGEPGDGAPLLVL